MKMPLVPKTEVTVENIIGMTTKPTLAPEAAMPMASTPWPCRIKVFGE